jgi:hypothetical protein
MTVRARDVLESILTLRANLLTRMRLTVSVLDIEIGNSRLTARRYSSLTPTRLTVGTVPAKNVNVT